MTQEAAHHPALVEPKLTGVRNFRDVGGLPTVDGRKVRYGVLFRSGHLAHATEEDTRILARLGIRTVFDFRNAADIALEGPDVELPGARRLGMPLSDPAQGADFWELVRYGEVEALREMLGNGLAVRRMIHSYRKIILERTAEHRRMLQELSENESLPALLHCAAGKDRAGLSVVIILLALGVKQEAIERDYLASNAHHRRYRIRRGDENAEPPSGEILELLSPLFDARLEYLAAAMKTIEETWGGPDRYLAEALDCGPDRRERLRELLLDGDPRL